MSQTLNLFCVVVDNLHNLSKKDRDLAAMNSELFALAMVYMKYNKTCILSSLPDFFESTELYSYSFTTSDSFEYPNGVKKYVIYASEHDRKMAIQIAMKQAAKL